MKNWFLKWWHAVQGLFYLGFGYYFVYVMVETAFIIFSLVRFPSKFSAKSISWPLKRSQKQADLASLSLFCFVAAFLVSKYVHGPNRMKLDKKKREKNVGYRCSFVVLPSSLNKQNVAKDKRQVGDNQWNCRAENIQSKQKVNKKERSTNGIGR